MNFIFERLRSVLSKQQVALKVLGSVFLGALLLLPAGAVYAGEGDSALGSNGLLTFETGSNDRFAHYREGNTGPVPDATQAVFDESKNKCELDQSGADPLMLLSEDNGQNVGFVGDSMGVFSRGGGGGNARGTKCGRINNDEQLIFTVPAFDSDGDGEVDNSAVIRSKIDAEFKHSAIAIITTEFGGQITGQFWISTGDNNGVTPSGLEENAVELVGCGDLSGTDNNNDSGANDNCHLEFEALWTSMTVEVQDGQISIEGGGDYSDSLANRSEFELVRVDGILDCQEGFVGSDPRVTGARLDNVDEGCDALVPFSVEYGGDNIQLLFETEGQETTWVINTEWPAELQLAEAEEEPTLVSWVEGDIDWEDCADPADESNPTCFVLSRCNEGEPVRLCSNDSTSCTIDDDCGTSGGTCEWINVEAPEGGFTDMDPDRPDTQYSCLCGQSETWLGTRGRNNVEDGLPPLGDDTEEDFTLVQQCIFLQGDIRWNR